MRSWVENVIKGDVTQAAPLPPDAVPWFPQPTTAIPTIAVGAPRIVPGERRSSMVVVPATIGAVTITFGVAGLKKGRMTIRTPLAADGTTAISAPPEIQHAVSTAILAAVQACPEAMEHPGHR